MKKSERMLVQGQRIENPVTQAYSRYKTELESIKSGKLAAKSKNVDLNDAIGVTPKPPTERADMKTDLLAELSNI